MLKKNYKQVSLRSESESETGSMQSPEKEKLNFIFSPEKGKIVSEKTYGVGISFDQILQLGKGITF